MLCDCGWRHDEAPPFAHTIYHDLRHQLTRIEHQQERIMTDQSHLEADVAAENASLDLIETEIANLKAQPGATALDFTSLDAATARLKGDEPAPVEQPPADGSGDGSAPVDAGDGSADAGSTDDGSTPSA